MKLPTEAEKVSQLKIDYFKAHEVAENRTLSIPGQRSCL
jgi:hypothetical protein